MKSRLAAERADGAAAAAAAAADLATSRLAAAGMVVAAAAAVKAVEAEPVAPGVEATAERGIAASQWAAVAAWAV